MLKFDNPEVDAKYQSKLGTADPIVHVVIGHDGPLSKISMAIADKIYQDGGGLELKKAEKPAPTEGKK